MCSLGRWLSGTESPTVNLQGVCSLRHTYTCQGFFGFVLFFVLFFFFLLRKWPKFTLIFFFKEDLLQAQQLLFVPGGEGLGWVSFIHLSVCLFIQQALLKADFGAWFWSIRWMVWFLPPRNSLSSSWLHFFFFFFFFFNLFHFVLQHSWFTMLC